MTIFIPENFIFFYVFGDTDGLISYFYGSVDSVLLQNAYFYNIHDIYDVILFGKKKLIWGPGWKQIYMYREAPFRLHLSINDRYNWCYGHTIYKLLSDINCSIFLTKFAAIKGYCLSTSRPLFMFGSYSEHFEFLNIGNYGPAVYVGIYEYWPIMGSAFIREGLSPQHDWNNKAHIFFLVCLAYDFLVLKTYDTILHAFTHIFCIVCLLMYSYYLYMTFFFLCLFFLSLIFYRKFILLEEYSHENFEYIYDQYFGRINFFIDRYIKVGKKLEVHGKYSFFFNFVLLVLNFIFGSEHKLLPGYGKYILVLLDLKRYLFRFNYSFLSFVFFFFC